MPLPEEALRQAVAELEERSLVRIPVEVPVTDDWVSNDLLGLSRDPAVVEASAAALRESGAGARAARALGGECAAHADLQDARAHCTTPPRRHAAAFGQARPTECACGWRGRQHTHVGWQT